MRPLHAQVLGVLVVLFLLGIAGILTVGYWTASTVDERALARQTAFVERGLNERFMRVPVEQESVSIWDDAFAAAKAGNIPWLDENIGLWMHSYFGHDQSYILTIGGKPLYAAQGDQPALPQSYETVRDVVTPVLRRLQYAVQAALSRGAPTRDLIGSLSTTFVIVTHEHEVAARTDRIIQLRDGYLVEYSSSDKAGVHNETG